MSFEASAWAKKQKTGSPARKAILMCLADAYNSHTRLCFPSQKRLAEEAEMSDRTLREHLAVMEEMGLIRRIRRTDSKGHRQPDFYELTGLESLAEDISGRDFAAAEAESLPEDISGRDDALPEDFDRPTGSCLPVHKEPESNQNLKTTTSSRGAARSGSGDLSPLIVIAPPPAALQAALVGWRSAMGEATWSAWLRDATLTAHDPPTIEARSPFQAQMLRQQHIHGLEARLGRRVEVTIAGARRAGEAGRQAGKQT